MKCERLHLLSDARRRHKDAFEAKIQIQIFGILVLLFWYFGIILVLWTLMCPGSSITGSYDVFVCWKVKKLRDADVCGNFPAVKANKRHSTC